MDRTQKIKKLVEGYCGYDSNFIEQSNKFLFYGEDEYVFGAMIEKMKSDNITPTPEDKQLIDEIGESLWNGGPYWQDCMQTKYWKDIVN